MKQPTNLSSPNVLLIKKGNGQKPRFSVRTLTVKVSLLKIWKDHSKISTEPVDMPLQSTWATRTVPETNNTLSGCRRKSLMDYSRRTASLSKCTNTSCYRFDRVLTNVRWWKPQKASAHRQRPYDWHRHSSWRLLHSYDDGWRGSRCFRKYPIDNSPRGGLWLEFIIPPTCATGPSITGGFFFYLTLPSSVSDQVLMLPMRCAGLVFRVGYCQVQQSGFEQKFGQTLWMSWVTLSWQNGNCSIVTLE